MTEFEGQWCETACARFRADDFFSVLKLRLASGENFVCKNLEYEDDLKFFEEAIRRLKEMWEQIKSVSKLEGRDDGEERLKG